LYALIIEQLHAKPTIARRHFSTLIGVDSARQPAPEKLKPQLNPSRGGRLTLHSGPA
jgi:hypothetical protein